MLKQSRQDYTFWVKLASTSAVVAALIMIIIKVIAWRLTDSASILATLADSIFDIAASTLNFFVIRYALIPADDDHRFGHGKAESLAGLLQAGFVIGSAILLFLHSLSRLSNPRLIQNAEFGILAILLTIGITFALVAVQHYALRRAHSVAIKADSLHYKGDLLMNLGVLFALVASPWGFLTLDAWIAMAIAGYLLFGALQIGRESLNSLMDKELPSDKHDAFLDIAKRVEGVMGVHDLRTRQSGGTIFIQLHLELDDNLTLIQAHNIGDRVEANLLAAEPNADILVHLDPISVVGQKRDPVKFHN